MRITDNEVSSALVLEAQKRFDEFLRDYTTSEGYGNVALLLARGGGGRHLTEPEKEKFHFEINMQGKALYIILAPIWLKLGRTLPVVDAEGISNVFERGARGEWQWSTVYDGIAQANGMWNAVLSTYREQFEDPASEVFVAAIAQAYLDRLGEPIEAEAVAVDPSSASSIDEQLKDILGGSYED